MKKSIIIVIMGLIVIVSLLFLLRAPKIEMDSDATFEYGHQELALIDLIPSDAVYDNLVFIYDGHDIENIQLNEVGTYDIEMRSRRGLSSVSKSLVVHVIDTQYPVIHGLKDLKVPFGGEISFDHITATDQVDGALKVKVEGQFDLNKSGVYQLYALATDINGNTTKEAFNLTVNPKPKPPVVQIPPQKSPKESEILYVNGHIFVNKKFGLPKSYNPGENPKARQQLNFLIQEMKDNGLDISHEVSGYRTYQRQEVLYNRYVKNDGVKKADTYSARPGHSDHQSGLTFDLKHNNGQLMGKHHPDKNDAEIAYVKENAHRFGFVVRYPKGKEQITGYMYEPWHLRYLGQDATAVYQSGLSMEEYFNVEGGDYK